MKNKNVMITPMETRLSEEKDVSAILTLYQKARSFMAMHGNPDQWNKGAPDLGSLQKDLSLARSLSECSNRHPQRQLSHAKPAYKIGLRPLRDHSLAG
jgi:hypothetical protein